MQIKQSTISWVLIFSAAFFFIYMVSAILMPFVFGAIVAYFLDPMADRLQDRGLSRNAASMVVMGVFMALVIMVIAIFGPLFFDQIGDLISKIPVYIAQMEHQHGEALQQFLHKIVPNLEDQAKDFAFKFSSELFKVSGVLLSGVISSGAAIFSVLSLLLISPIVAFYLLKDWDVLVKKIDDLLPREKLSVLRKNFKKIDSIISAYIRGQVLVCLIMAVFYSANLTIIGLNYGFAIGFMTGILTFVPYIGVISCGAIGLIVGFTQFGMTDGLLLTLVVFVFGSLIEGNFVTPKLVGKSVELHPAWIIFALLAGGTIVGFTGILVAIPAAAIIGVVMRSSVDAYKHSGLYLGYDSVQITSEDSPPTQEGIVTEREETPVFNGFETSQAPHGRKIVDDVNISSDSKSKKKKKKKKEPELKFHD